MSSSERYYCEYCDSNAYYTVNDNAVKCEGCGLRGPMGDNEDECALEWSTLQLLIILGRAE